MNNVYQKSHENPLMMYKNVDNESYDLVGFCRQIVCNM